MISLTKMVQKMHSMKNLYVLADFTTWKNFISYD